MNLILVEESECVQEEGLGLVVNLPPKDRRSVHIRTVLKLETNDSVRVGIIGGLMYDAQVIIIDGYKLVLSKQRVVTGTVDEDISLLLAFPRPKALGRMFQVFSQQGLHSIKVCNAARVEKSYWGSHIANESFYRPALLKGLEQASVSTRLPDLEFDSRPLEVFLKHFDTLYPSESFIRLLCHPHDAQPLTPALSEIVKSTGRRKVVIAIGPEGGWLDFELDLLIKGYGFICVSFSPRILSTDVAVTCVVSLVSDVLRN